MGIKGDNISVIKSLTSIFYFWPQTAFKPHSCPSPFGPTAEQADTKAWVFFLLVMVRSWNHTSPDIWTGTLTPALPSNYHKGRSSLLSLLSRISLGRLPLSPESLIMWVINLSDLLGCVWHMNQIWGDGAHPTSSGWHRMSRQWPPLQTPPKQGLSSPALACSLARLPAGTHALWTVPG